MTLEAGSRLGGYEILGHIGAGGMGASGRRVERVCESSRGSRRGGGATREFLKKTDFAHRGDDRWR
jgi:hypothetical protein